MQTAVTWSVIVSRLLVMTPRSRTLCSGANEMVECGYHLLLCSPAVIASEPYQLCLLRIQAQPVGAYPCGDISDAVGKLTNGILGAVYRRVDVHLTDVGVKVSTCSMRSYNAEDL